MFWMYVREDHRPKILYTVEDEEEDDEEVEEDEEEDDEEVEDMELEEMEEMVVWINSYCRVVNNNRHF